MSPILDHPKGAPGAPAGGPGPLPCLNSNNCTNTPQKKGSGYALKTVGKVAGIRVAKAADGREYIEYDHTPGVYQLIDREAAKQGSDLKRMFALRWHVKAFIDYWTREHSLFFTTTDKDGIPPKEYAKRWHSLLAHESEWIKGFVRVLEPMKKGRPHFHNVIAVPFDTMPDAFNWEAFNAAQVAYAQKDWATYKQQKKVYVASAPPELVELWHRFSPNRMARYGLGRCEILPIRKQGGISEYIGKYLDKGMTLKLDAWKGVRRFETDRRTSIHWKRCSLKFSWVSPGASAWRKRVGELANALGCDTTTGDTRVIKAKLGPRWAYRLKGAIQTAPQDEWDEMLAALALSFAARPGEVVYDNGGNSAW